ncbi:MAG: hypothetical protein B6D56_06515 [Candidatus Omnitrophica bacterium 4484_70.1]|nr:MAG: hypothetical protein B6D56_06515 [Candidatus Omnitrophica bacterium 4484_70.1]
MKKKKKVSIFLIILLTLLLGIISYFCYRKKIGSKEKELIQVEKKITLIQRILKLEKDWNEEAEIYLCANIASLKKTIEDMAKNIEIKNWKILDTQRKKYAFHKRMVLELVASYKNLVNFLKKIELYPFIDMKKIFVGRKSDEELEIKLEFVGLVKK